MHQTFAPDQFRVQEYYRFEGMTYPGDSDSIYAIETWDGGVRGTLVCPYGIYADHSMATLLMGRNQAVETIA